jgi:hypothetical protein
LFGEGGLWTGHFGGSLTAGTGTPIAAVLLATQALLFVVSLVADAIWIPISSQGFLAATLLFAVVVGLDALIVGLGWKRAPWWAFVVTIAWIFGVIPYARRRQYLRRSGRTCWRLAGRMRRSQ